jgi:hypothetical protein
MATPSFVVIAGPATRQQITAPMHTALLAAKALLRHLGLSALLIACAGQLYLLESNFPTSIFDGVRNMEVRSVGGSRRSAGVSLPQRGSFDVVGEKADRN